MDNSSSNSSINLWSDCENEDNYSESVETDISIDSTDAEESHQNTDRFCLYGNEPEYDSDELADLYFVSHKHNM